MGDSMSLGGRAATTAHHSRLPVSSAGHAAGAATGFSGGSLGVVPEQLLRDVISASNASRIGDMNGEFCIARRGREDKKLVINHGRRERGKVPRAEKGRGS